MSAAGPVGAAREVLVVGSGIAGLTCALDLVAAGADVTLTTKGALGGGSTAWAQGGIAAVVPDPDGADGADGAATAGAAARGTADPLADPLADSVAQHVADTLAAGAGASSARVAALVCAGGAAAITALVARGVAFDRDGARWARGLEAAHGHHRVLHAGGDSTGSAISAALVAAVRAVAEQPGARLRLVEHAALVDLVVDAEVVVGADLLLTAPEASLPGAPTGVRPAAPAAAGASARTVRHRADAVVLATGGAGQVYAVTTNPAGATGDGLAAAWRAGAVVADPEMVQFHPTCAVTGSGAFLVSEAVRGEGAVLRDERGRRYLLQGPLAHPRAELAPRDVVARATAAAMAAQDGRPVELDATGVAAALGRRLDVRFPGIDALCRAAGIDWVRHGVPVTPAAHYAMGGVLTDDVGRTTVPGLWAVGEVACTGLHGANRLASNSLLEAAVLAARAAADVASGGLGAATVSGPVRELAGEAAVLDRAELQRLMWDHAGLLREAAGLELAAKTLEGPRAPGDRTGQGGTGPLAALEDADLAVAARLVVAGALARTESRGAHHRTDHPSTDARARRTLLRRAA